LSLFSLPPLFALLCLVAWASAAVQTDFDAELEGWRVTGDNAAAWSGLGNPGGCLSVNDLAIGDDNRAIAPLVLLGNWSGLSNADTLSLDYFFQNTSGGAIVPAAYVFCIAGPGGAAHAIANYVPPQSAWTDLRVGMAAANWILESGTWGGLLADVNSLTIAGEFVTG